MEALRPEPVNLKIVDGGKKQSVRREVSEERKELVRVYLTSRCMGRKADVFWPDQETRLVA